MREILFKAKRIDNGEWVEGYVFDDGFVDSKRMFVGGLVIMDYKGKADDRWEVGTAFYEVDPKTICQYTGLTDKNGKKIWENDVVKRYTSSGDEWRISKIVWADYSLNMGWCIEDVKSLAITSSRLFSVGFDVNDTKKCEVIGNIFDNFELLKGE